jgi:hypothetical protein
MQAILISLVMIALLLLAAIVGLLVLWVAGAKTVLLPGLGFVVGTPLLLALLIGVEVVVTISVVFLWRLSSA